MSKRWVPIFIIFAVLVSIMPNFPVSAENLGQYQKRGYNPSQVYSGSYEPEIVYYRPSQKTFWRRGLNGTFPENVNCPEALNSLMRGVLWKGRINLKGACRETDEPSEWAVGNRLNFDENAHPSATE